MIYKDVPFHVFISVPKYTPHTWSLWKMYGSAKPNQTPGILVHTVAHLGKCGGISHRVLLSNVYQDLEVPLSSCRNLFLTAQASRNQNALLDLFSLFVKRGRILANALPP